ncbi:MAG TPA: alpha-glucuronidase family glycosyl hydrolase [Draconibacterium sp.]|nr:alpha-glucuronidase family glycosyl hydrolase [Draconibacterium sp.]
MKNKLKSILSVLAFLFACLVIPDKTNAEDGYELWLRYKKVENPALIEQYSVHLKNVVIVDDSPTFTVVKNELRMALSGLLGKEVIFDSKPAVSGSLIIGKRSSANVISENTTDSELKNLGEEGYLIRTTGNKHIIITGNSDVGILYGVFKFIQLIQQEKEISALNISDSPKTKIRILNHWDNVDRTVERGYAGFSLWDWFRLPDVVDPRYTDYARANASIGINGAVVTNVNANALILTPVYLEKVAKLADVFRPYGIKIYLTARFSAPIELDKLPNADPLNPEVQQWWKKKAEEIYKYIPDFGGFLIKANSEGQPGPQNYNRNHAEGANLIADAVAPFGGIVMWRAFVYDQNVPDDRAKQAYNEFKPLDGQFRDNVIVQVKNGPIDFQPREPFHPLFGAMEKSNIMMEFQITQEYLGFSTHLVYLAPLFEECLKADTYAKSKGSAVANSIDGTLHGQKLTGIAGVTNIGTDRNWTGHPFGQANWFAFGRLAWNPYLSSEEIADEWIRMTFNLKEEFVDPIKKMMLESRETCVNYMTPLGLHHIMGRSHHHGPGPWVAGGRPDWTSLYYHRADSVGIGFNRTNTGSNASGQYFPPVADIFNNIETCPEEFLLWFHHVPWNYKMKSGKTLWDEMCFRYNDGVLSVREMQKTWDSMKEKVDKPRFEYVQSLLKIQEKEAVWWRNSCLLYFQTFSKMPIPASIEKADKTLEEYMNIREFFMPGI